MLLAELHQTQTNEDLVGLAAKGLYHGARTAGNVAIAGALALGVATAFNMPRNLKYAGVEYKEQKNGIVPKHAGRPVTVDGKKVFIWVHTDRRTGIKDHRWAEYDKRYDPDWKNDGQDDPNVIAAKQARDQRHVADAETTAYASKIGNLTNRPKK